MLPAEQEPHEILRGNRLDLPPPTLPGVGVNPRQQPPGAELFRPTVPAEPAADREALGFQSGKPADDQRLGQPAGCCEGRRCRRSAAVEMTAERVRRGALLVRW